MKNYRYFVGLDISKNTIDAFALSKDSAVGHWKVSNSAEGIKELITSIVSETAPIKQTFFCIENTGHYQFPLCAYLESCRAHYTVVVGLQIKRSLGIVRAKTDKFDAKKIAEYGRAHHKSLTLYSIPEMAILKLKVLQTERDKITKCLLSFERSSESKDYLPEEAIKFAHQTSKGLVVQLQEARQKVEKEMKKIVDAHPVLKLQYDLITSVPGVGPVTAIYLITVTRCFKAFENWRKLACWSGVAPFETSSGTIKHRTKIHRFGDRKMKSLLNLCALNAKRGDREIMSYYEKKIREGKAPMMVLNAIRCKVLARVFAVIRKQAPYVKSAPI